MKHVINTAVGFLLSPNAKCRAHEIGIKINSRFNQFDFAILIHDRA